MAKVPLHRQRSFRIGGWCAALLPWLVLAFGMLTMPENASSANMASDGNMIHQFIMGMAIIPCCGCPGVVFFSVVAYWIVGPCTAAFTEMLTPRDSPS